MASPVGAMGMGCLRVFSDSDPDPEAVEAKERNDQIDLQLEQWAEERRKDLKVVFFGVDGAGTSTLMKHFKLAYDEFSADERRSFVPKIFTHIVQSMRRIIESIDLRDKFPINWHSEHHVHAILRQPTEIQGSILDSEVASAVEALWEEGLIRQGLEDLREETGDSCSDAGLEHYFADIRRIASAEYIPDNQDIVLIHPPPKGIHEMTFQLAHTTHRYFDMGREYRNLPQKKLHFLDDVKFLVFVVPIAEYDSPSSEEPQPASLRAALDQFISIINSPWFSNASTFIFFNQMDKFKKKLASSPLESHFPDFNGGGDFASAAKYIVNLFLREVEKEEEDKPFASSGVYIHFTCGVDFRNMGILASAMQDVFHPSIPYTRHLL